MAYILKVPKTSSSHETIELEKGQALFVLGANGAGKSKLMQRLFNGNSEKAQRVSAHRQITFNSSGVDIAPSSRAGMDTNFRNADNQPRSTHFDDYAAQRIGSVLFDLIEAENERSRMIASYVDVKNQAEAVRLSESKSAPLVTINELLRLSNIPIVISVGDHAQIYASKRQGTPFGINRLSDGERNAVIIAATVLTAKSGNLLLIDEPERHFHRSIIAPLLSNLFKQRSDCAFVISTHDVSLAVDNAPCRILLVRNCVHESETPVAWECDLVDDPDGIDDGLRADILGARKKTLFVEGNKISSLDARLYNIVFGDISVVPKDTCRDVMNTVKAIRNTSSLHWVHAYGLIDHDQREASEVESLRAEGVYALPAHSVEGIYYHPKIQQRVASRKCSTDGGNPELDCQRSREKSIEVLKQKADYLCQRKVEQYLRHQVLGALPKHHALTETWTHSVDVAAELRKEKVIFNDLIERQDLIGLLGRYPIKNSRFPKTVSVSLRFLTEKDYQQAVVKMLHDDPDALNFVRSMFQSLIADLSGAYDRDFANDPISSSEAA